MRYVLSLDTLDSFAVRMSLMRFPQIVGFAQSVTNPLPPPQLVPFPSM